MKKKTKIVYLLAMPFSGTTLLSRLMALHPDITTVGEMVNVISNSNGRDYTCSCGATLSDCSFWQGVRHNMAIQGQRLELENFKLTPPAFLAGLAFRTDYHLSRYIPESWRNRAIRFLFSHGITRDSGLTKRIQAFSDSVIAQSGKSIFFDASKNPNLVFYLAANDLFELVFVHMVRDPRGVSLSMMRNLSKPSFAVCISEWVAMNKKIQWLLSLFPEARTVTVRYEDLCENPELFMNSIYREIGATPFNIDLGCTEDSHIIGNRMRLNALDKIVPDDNWRQRITEGELQKARDVAGSLASQYGYTM